MVIQRLGSGLAWFALAAVGLLLLRPELFPDVRLPAKLADPDLRGLLGLMVSLSAAALGVGAVLHWFRGAASRPKRI